MEFSLQSAHPDIFDRIALCLPLSSRLQLAATCRSMRSRVVFWNGRSQLENLPISVLRKVMHCMPSHTDRLRLGAASWTLRKWAIQNGLLTLHCQTIRLQEDRFEFLGEHDQHIGYLPFRDGDTPIRAATGSFSLETDFSRAHIDQSIRRLSSFRPPLRPDEIYLQDSDTLGGRSDDPTAVRRLVEYLIGASKPFKSLYCVTVRTRTLLLESNFLHRVQARNVCFRVGDIGPDGLDFAVEGSMSKDSQSCKYPCVRVELPSRETSTNSPPIVLGSILRFVRAHFSSNLDIRFKYDVLFYDRNVDDSAAIRTLANECGIQLETRRLENVEELRFETSSNPVRIVASGLFLDYNLRMIFVGAGKCPWSRDTV